MKKVVNRKNVIIGLIVLVICSGLITINALYDKSNSSLNNKFNNETKENEINKNEEQETKVTEGSSKSTDKVQTDKITAESKNVTSNVKTTSTTKKANAENTTTKTSQMNETTTTTTTVKTQAQKNDEYRKQLLSKYNVTVGYKDEIDGKYVNSYATPTKLYDDEVISYNLTKIENALKKYPKSFFSEIKNKWKPISIYLVDYINGYAGGVTDNNNSSTLVILIVATHSPKSSILENTVHHELMHAIDCYFTSKGIYSSYILEQSIAKYNPEGFSYGVQDNKYVYLLEDPCYFVSKYSKANYKEDRAEVFANLMYRSYAPSYLKAGHPINEKAKTITNQINQNFTSAASGNNRWDKLVAH